jgi:hypothetical protein
MAAAQSGNDWRIGGITQSSGRMSPHRHLRQARCVSDASLSGSRVTIQSTEKHANSQMSPERPQGVAVARWRDAMCYDEADRSLDAYQKATYARLVALERRTTRLNMFRSNSHASPD